MLFPDYHFHTDFSSDCDEPIQAVIASAKEKDLSALLPNAQVKGGLAISGGSVENSENEM